MGAITGLLTRIPLSGRLFWDISLAPKIFYLLFRNGETSEPTNGIRKLQPVRSI